MNVLIVEDDQRVASFLQRGLREEGYQADWCADGASALEQGKRQPYDVVLLDWSLPDMDGIAVLRQWRAAGIQTPVIVVTARTGVDATVVGLDAGADDYIAKPFRFEELLARIRANTRRAPGQQSGKVRIGAATVDLRARTVQRGDDQDQLSNREYELLMFLLKNRGDILSRTRILDRVWGMDHDPTTNVVDVYIRYLRNKLDLPNQPSAIETVRGRGYRLNAEPGGAT